MGKAILLKDISKDFTGEAGLYELKPSFKFKDYDNKEKVVKYVIVSATIAMFGGAETYIFPATKNGKVKDWGELKGSYGGGLSQKTALANMGYKT